MDHAFEAAFMKKEIVSREMGDNKEIKQMMKMAIRIPKNNSTTVKGITLYYLPTTIIEVEEEDEYNAYSESKEGIPTLNQETQVRK